ncbi:hypothetical protein VDR48_19885 [Xanthomonas campestris pv. campestris]|nr:hypothetical protein [Xanthomonas campestris pv. campestris]MEB1789637.1 hypothetical protein [Xanthomonas campestris pv. campestris]MEB1844519.1 hypothetical protein [Xanthomonas campestris pv. campestris]MEB1878279.1 hypothetical protein [Xanthomonas campestris pv. campestris]
MKTKVAYYLGELLKFSGVLILAYMAVVFGLIRSGGVEWIETALPNGALDYLNGSNFLIGLLLVVLGFGVQWVFPVIPLPGDVWRNRVKQVRATLIHRQARTSNKHKVSEIQLRLDHLDKRYSIGLQPRRRWRRLRDY